MHSFTILPTAPRAPRWLRLARAGMGVAAALLALAAALSLATLVVGLGGR